MKYFKDFKNLCTPASVYLAINVIVFIVIAIQNFGNTKEYCVGQYKCNVPNTVTYYSLQTRSLDEPSTTFFICTNPKCKNTWKY